MLSQIPPSKNRKLIDVDDVNIRSNNISKEDLKMSSQIFGDSDSDSVEYEDQNLNRQASTTVQFHEIRKQVLEEDIPERLLLQENFDQTALYPSSEEVKKESTFIWNKIRKNKSAIEDEHTLQQQIENVIHLFRILHFDIPFIVNYRKDQYQPSLTEEDVWEIFRIHSNDWNIFSKTKANL